MTEEEWSAKFDEMYENYLIDVPKDFFTEETCFKDPNDIEDIFSDLEERNLFLIHNRQETEQSLEEQNTKRNAVEFEMGTQFKLHNTNLNYLQGKIESSQRELALLEKEQGLAPIKRSKVDAEEVTIDMSAVLKRLTQYIRPVYQSMIESSMDMKNRENLGMLN